MNKKILLYGETGLKNDFFHVFELARNLKTFKGCNFELLKKFKDCNDECVLILRAMDTYYVNLKLFDELLQCIDIESVFLYNHKIIEYVLNRLLFDNYKFHFDEDKKKFVKQVILDSYEDLMLINSLYKSYEWDYVIRQDNLSGNLKNDFQYWFDDIQIENVNYVKRGKRKLVSNYEEFENFYYDVARENGFPILMPISRSDI